MTPQERELLVTFLQQLMHTQVGQKDVEANALIQDASIKQPDTAYLLVQRAIGLDYALQASQAEAAKFKVELDQLRSRSNSSLLGNANVWGRTATANPALAPAAGLALSPHGPAQLPMTSAAPASSWGSGILGTVATTAAGVVAGSFLFHGMQSMMDNRNKSSNTAENLPSSETNKITANNEEPTEIQHDSNYFADAGSSDFDSSEVA